MADFFLIVGPSETRAREADRARRIVELLGLGNPCDQVETEQATCLLFARRDGSRPDVESQDGTTRIAVGTWRGPDGDSGTFAIDDSEVAGFGALLELSPGSTRVSTDPIASHQVHWRQGEDHLAVSTSALLLSALGEDELDPIGCQELLLTGILYEDRTPWRSVRRLDPDTIFEIARDGLTSRPAGRLTLPETGDLSGQEAIEACADGLRRMARRLRNDEGLIADLTGGWDSRLLISALLDQGVKFSTTVTGSSDSADVRIAESIAREFGFDHVTIPPMAAPTFDELEESTRLSEGEVNPVAYSRILRVHRQLMERGSMSLNGSFGEVARGYWWEILSPGPSAVRAVPARLIAERRYAATAPSFDLFRSADRIDPTDHFTAILERVDADANPNATQGLRLDRTYLRMRMRSWQGRIATTTDRIWPCLSPLIFPEVLEPLLRTRPLDRAHDRLVRRLLVELHPQLARRGLENGGPAVPMTPTNLWRFTPMAWKLGRRVVRKVLGAARKATTVEETSAPRLAMLADERVREILDPGEMRTAALFEAPALESFVRAAHTEEFRDEQPFSRLLGLEMAARLRERLRSASASPTGSR